MIKTFKHKALAEFFNTGKSAKIAAYILKRIKVRLNALDAASRPEEMNVPGYNFRALHGFKPARYTVHVNGPWCITFAFQSGDAYDVNLEQYHLNIDITLTL